MNSNLAQQLIISIEPDPSGGVVDPVRISGPLVGISSVGDLLSVLLKFIFPFAGILLFLYFVRGGFSMLTSQGDVEKINNGKAIMTHALFGFVMLAISYVVAGLVARIFGLGLGLF